MTIKKLGCVIFRHHATCCKLSPTTALTEIIPGTAKKSNVRHYRTQQIEDEELQ